MTYTLVNAFQDTAAISFLMGFLGLMATIFALMARDYYHDIPKPAIITGWIVTGVSIVTGFVLLLTSIFMKVGS